VNLIRRKRNGIAFYNIQKAFYLKYLKTNTSRVSRTMEVFKSEEN